MTRMQRNERRLTRVISTVTAVLVVGFLWAAPCCEAAPLKVTVVSGRTFAGEVAKRTDDDRLWLRTTSGGIELLRPIKWQRIVGGEHDGRQYDAQQMRELALSLRTNDSEPEFRYEESVPATPGDLSYAEQASRQLGFAPRIRTVEFDAHLANWDADVEADGLIVYVRPLDEYGEIVAANATLDVALYAFQRRDLDQAVHSRGLTIERVTRWTERLDADFVGPNGAVFKLPYKAIQPEVDTEYAPIGIVNVRLAAPGHGVFEDSLDDVRIRRYSAVRDTLQRHVGRRFLPAEMTDQGR